jgi:hypothetical protein
MALLTLRLSDQPVITLPTELARRAGLAEGQVQVIPNHRRVTILPIAAPADYTARWESLSVTLREQAAQFDLAPADGRDAAYWETVAPLFEEVERFIGAG